MDYQKLQRAVDLLKRNLPDLNRCLPQGMVAAVQTVTDALTPPKNRRILILSSPPPEDFRYGGGLECCDCPVHNSEFGTCNLGLGERRPVYGDDGEIRFHVLTPASGCPWKDSDE